MSSGGRWKFTINLGTGILEAIYQEVLEIELSRPGIPFEAQKTLTLEYKGQQMKKGYVADLVCYGQLIIELKVMDRLTNIEVAQLINYLKVTKLHVGLLFNFGSLGQLEWKRYVI